MCAADTKFGRHMSFVQEDVNVERERRDAVCSDLDMRGDVGRDEEREVGVAWNRAAAVVVAIVG